MGLDKETRGKKLSKRAPERVRAPLHPRQAAYREGLDRPVAGTHRRKNIVGCYECCQGPGARRALWDRLCTKCRKITRAEVHCGYLAVLLNPRIRVPRLTSTSRWKQFLNRYPKFRFREELRHVETAGS